jgi:hypothetical protein
MSSGTISYFRVWSNSILLNSKKSTTSLMVHTLQKLKDIEFKSRFRNSTTLRSLKHVINIIIWIRDTGCYTNAHPRIINKRHKKK